MEVRDSGGRYQPLPTDEDAAEEKIELTGDDLGPESSQLDVHHDSFFSFVEASWFQMVSACVIIFNTIAVFLEADDGRWKVKLFWFDQFTLCFYIVELICRICFYGIVTFICGPWKIWVWNVLDLLVVNAGVADQWVLPFCPVGEDSPLFSVILMFRLLRLVRVMKIIRVFLETDLSWTENPGFQSFIGGVIAFNALLMGMETDIKWTGWFYIEQVLLVIYVFELLVRLKRFGLEFVSCHNPDITWNVLDFFIVVSSAADSWVAPGVKIIGKQFTNSHGRGAKHAKGMKLSQVMMLMRMLRLMRILRLVKLVKSVRPLYILVTGVLAAFQGVAWVLVLTVVTLYAAGILATRLLGHGLLFPHGTPPPGAYVFKSVPDSMFTLFRVMSGAESDEEAHAIDELMIALPTIKFAFIFFMVTSSWTLLSILTAVVSDNMITTTGQQMEELRIASDDEERVRHKKELTKLFESMSGCAGAVKKVTQQDMEKFLENKENALKTAKVCCIATRNVRAVLKTLDPDGKGVAMEEFVERMLDAGKPVTEQSVMKIETLFRDSQRQVDEGCKVLRDKVDHWRDNFRKKQQADREVLDRGSLDRTAIEAITNLVEQQRRNSEGIVKLHESVEALIRSQDALRQQNSFSNARKGKLEADLIAMQKRHTDAFARLGDNIESVREDLLRLTGSPSQSSFQPYTKAMAVLENGSSSCAATAQLDDSCQAGRYAAGQNPRPTHTAPVGAPGNPVAESQRQPAPRVPRSDVPNVHQTTGAPPRPSSEA